MSWRKDDTSNDDSCEMMFDDDDKIDDSLDEEEWVNIFYPQNQPHLRYVVAGDEMIRWNNP